MLSDVFVNAAVYHPSVLCLVFNGEMEVVRTPRSYFSTLVRFVGHWCHGLNIPLILLELRSIGFTVDRNASMARLVVPLPCPSRRLTMALKIILEFLEHDIAISSFCIMRIL